MDAILRHSPLPPKLTFKQERKSFLQTQQTLCDSPRDSHFGRKTSLDDKPNESSISLSPFLSESVVSSEMGSSIGLRSDRQSSQSESPDSGIGGCALEQNPDVLRIETSSSCSSVGAPNRYVESGVDALGPTAFDIASRAIGLGVFGGDSSSYFGDRRSRKDSVGMSSCASESELCRLDEEQDVTRCTADEGDDEDEDEGRNSEQEMPSCDALEIDEGDDEDCHSFEALSKSSSPCDQTDDEVEDGRSIDTTADESSKSPPTHPSKPQRGSKLGDESTPIVLPKLPIPIKCSECDHSFHSNASFAIHLRKHTGERPFVCDECGLGFTQKGNLSRHKQTHLDRKPFKCDQCNYATKRKDALLTHKSTHFLSKRYKCIYCSQAYKQRQSLRDHLRTCHRVPNGELREVLSESVTQTPTSQSALDHVTEGYVDFERRERHLMANRHHLQQQQQQQHHQQLMNRKTFDYKTKLPPINDTLQRRSSSYLPISPPLEPVAFHPQDRFHGTRQDNPLPDGPVSQNRESRHPNQDSLLRQLPPLPNNPFRTPNGTHPANVQSFLPHPTSATPSHLATALTRPLTFPSNTFSSNPSNFKHALSSNIYAHGSLASNPSGFAPGLNPITTQHHINALAAAYNIPGYTLNNSARDCQQTTSGSNAAVAIAYAHHKQLEAARRLNPALPKSLPPLFKSQMNQLSVSTGSETTKPAENQLHSSESRPKAQKLNQKMNLDGESMDQENRHERDSNPRPIVANNEASSSCLSCQSQKSSLKCETCCITFGDQVMYTIHLGLHSKIDPLKCNLCGFLAENRYDFASHITRGNHKPAVQTSPVKTL